MTIQTASTSTTRRSAIERSHSVVAGLMALLVLVLAVIAGRSLFGTWDILVHGYVGNAVFVLALANGALAVKRRKGELLAFVVGLLVFAQVGLGYVGRETLEAAAWHVPNGVLIMGLCAFQFAETRQRAS